MAFKFPLRPIAGQCISSGYADAHHSTLPANQQSTTLPHASWLTLRRIDALYDQYRRRRARAYADAGRSPPEGRADVEISIARPFIFRDANGDAWELPLGRYSVDETLAQHWYCLAHQSQAVRDRGGRLAQPFPGRGGTWLEWLPEGEDLHPWGWAYFSDLQHFMQIENPSAQVMFAGWDVNGEPGYELIQDELAPARYQPLPRSPLRGSSRA